MSSMVCALPRNGSSTADASRSPGHAKRQASRPHPLERLILPPYMAVARAVAPGTLLPHTGVLPAMLMRTRGAPGGATPATGGVEWQQGIPRPHAERCSPASFAQRPPESGQAAFGPLT